MFGADLSRFDCSKCALAKSILAEEERYIAEGRYAELDFAHERKIFTEKYCGDDCENPPILEGIDEIELNDGITEIRPGSTVHSPKTLNQNPTRLITNYFYNEIYDLCVFAESGHLPQAGGILEQDTDFIDYYKIYLSWKNIRKVEKKPE